MRVEVNPQRVGSEEKSNHSLSKLVNPYVGKVLEEYRDKDGRNFNEWIRNFETSALAEPNKTKQDIFKDLLAEIIVTVIDDLQKINVSVVDKVIRTNPQNLDTKAVLARTTHSRLSHINKKNSKLFRRDKVNRIIKWHNKANKFTNKRFRYESFDKGIIYNQKNAVEHDLNRFNNRYNHSRQKRTYNLICYNCGRKGHRKFQCWENKDKVLGYAWKYNGRQGKLNSECGAYALDDL